MKKYWACQWQVVPGDGVHKERFSSLAEAKAAMRQKICENINIQEVLDELDPAAGDYLGKYLSDPNFPYSAADNPDYEEPEEGDLILHSGFILLEYPYGAHPTLHTNIVTCKDPDAEYTLDFGYENYRQVPKGRVTGMSISITPAIDYGTSAYAIMVKEQLDTTPKTHSQIISKIESKYNCTLDRKAVGRHIELLKAMGYNIQRNQKGYYIPDPKSMLTWKERDVLLNCVRADPQLTDERRQELIKKLSRLFCRDD